MLCNFVITEQNTWEGTTEVVHYEEANLWIGPSAHNMTRLGAMFAPCIRPDQVIGSKLARYRSIAQGNRLGCCEVTGIGAGGWHKKIRHQCLPCWYLTLSLKYGFIHIN